MKVSFLKKHKNAEKKKKGDEGEAALNTWLKDQNLSYVAICQATETFSPLFKDDVKRPDFLLLFESIGLIAVDAKNYNYSGGVYTLNLKKELNRSIAFERLIRIPLWYAYYDKNEKDGQDSWYWISALKAAEVGEHRVSKDKDTGEDVPFLAIKRNEFEHIVDASDLAKLYTHRLPGVSKIANL
ncbi:MAG: hypothetical protein JKY17_06465 [Magnetovibrio sp.]|nr:hypothetical protein [Magnetovibrio sp.]